MGNEIAFAVIMVALVLAGVYILAWTRKQESNEEQK